MTVAQRINDTDMQIAFFDLDKTLISRNSASLWIRYEFEAGRITTRQALQAVVWVIRYNLGAADMAEPIRRSIEALAGQPEDEIRDRTQRFHANLIRPLYRPGARRALEQHRAAGHRLVLLTSASNYLAEQVCGDLELDDYVCNRLEVDGRGRYTGRPIEPLCFGPGKVVLAERYAAAQGSSVNTCAFYSDSLSDLPMLEAAAQPMVVHPDVRLRRLARKRGWRILDWGQP